MITIEKKQDLWILGDVNGLKFEMKVYAPSSFGIKNGSIVKLFLYKKNVRTGRYSCVVQYDRGWYKRGRPKEPRTVIAVKELLNFTNRIYGNQEKIMTENITLTEFLNEHFDDYVYLTVDDGTEVREVCDVAVKFLHLWVLHRYGFCLVKATRRPSTGSKYDVYDVIIKENNN